MKPTGLGARNAGASSGRDHGKAARLVEIGGDLGEELVGGEPDRDGDAEIALDVGARSAPAPWPALMPCRRSVPVKSRKASSIDSGSTSGVRSSMRLRTCAADLGVFRHVRPDHRRRAGSGAWPRTSAWPSARRRCARCSRQVETTPRLPPPTISGLSIERRVVALLDGGVEGVAVDMGDGERVELGVADQPRRAAGGQRVAFSGASARQSRQKLTAPRAPSRRRRRARDGPATP